LSQISVPDFMDFPSSLNNSLFFIGSLLQYLIIFSQSRHYGFQVHICLQFSQSGCIFLLKGDFKPDVKLTRNYFHQLWTLLRGR